MGIVITGYWKIDLYVWLDHPDRIQVYWQGAVHPTSFNEKSSYATGEYEPRKRIRTFVRTDNINLTKIRLDPGDEKGTSRIYGMTLRSFFSKDIKLKPEDIHRIFKPARDGVTMELHPRYVEIESTVRDPHIVSTRSFAEKPGPFYMYVLPALLAAIFYRTFNPKIFDLSGEVKRKRPSRGGNIDALDGLRGFAALMVIADHTMGFFPVPEHRECGFSSP